MELKLGSYQMITPSWLCQFLELDNSQLTWSFSDLSMLITSDWACLSLGLNIWAGLFLATTNIKKKIKHERFKRHEQQFLKHYFHSFIINTSPIRSIHQTPCLFLFFFLHTLSYSSTMTSMKLNTKYMCNSYHWISHHHLPSNGWVLTKEWHFYQNIKIIQSLSCKLKQTKLNFN